MNESRSQNILAVDVGNSCVKLGWFPEPGSCDSPAVAAERAALPIAAPPLPEPAGMIRITHRDRDEREWLAEVEAWLDDALPPVAAACLLASVNRAAAHALMERLDTRRWEQLAQITASVVPIAVRVDEPARVGVDRLLGAVAANRLHQAHHPAITVDMGTAVTVNLLDADGAFCGGAILAGPVLTLAALNAGTSSLPLLGADALTHAPPALGKTTVAALASGAYWGGVGAVNQVLERLAAECSGTPAVFLTGGAAEYLSVHIGLSGATVKIVPHLVLAGIRLTADAVLAT